MAIIKIVPKEDWEVVKKYVNGGEANSGIVLIPEEVYEALSADVKEAIQNKEGYDDSYAFGDEADVDIDVVLSEEHFFIGHILDFPDGEAQ